MTDTPFDPDLLFRRKAEYSGYRFCPWCSDPLILRALDGHPRMVCARETCGFVFYQNPIPAAGGIIVKEDAILLVKRAHPPLVGWWCIPAGFMEWPESPQETAIREIREETGLQVRLIDLFEIYSGNDDPRSNAVLVLYRAEVVGGELRAADDALDVRFFPFTDLPDQIAFEAHRQALADYDRRYRTGRR